MNSFAQSCKNSLDYPKNLVQHEALSHNLIMHFKRLRDQGKRLFDESHAAVDFLDFSDEEKEFRLSCVKNIDELKELLREAFGPDSSDPQSRFIFIHAPQSRAPLRISHEMLCFLFSYHQVIPSFLDFVLPFGKQEYARDFHFSGLREESRLDMKQKGPEIPQLGRSGKEIRLCYNLRSVEQSHGQPDMAWSIRQSAIYHSFDLKTGKSLWINVKGNRLMKNRIHEASMLPSSKDIESLSEAFAASLATHLLVCDWSGENWRWYINDLEDQLQALTRNTLTAQIDEEPDAVLETTPFVLSPRSRSGSFPAPLRSFTGTSPKVSRSNTEPFSPIFPSRTTTLIEFPGTPPAVQNEVYCSQHGAPFALQRKQSSMQWHDYFLSTFKKISSSRIKFWKNPSSQNSLAHETSNEKPEPIAARSGERLTPLELPPTLGDQDTVGTFSFSDLQRIQYLEEKAQEALLVLRLNAEVLEELRRHYSYAIEHVEFPQEIKNDCQTELIKFNKCVLGVEKDLRMLQSRTEALLQLLANRNSLLNGIIQYRSVKANEVFAKKAQISADNMETMTIEMHEIAQKTKQETVSMRVITSVTLFFLPSTFIATFMSTDILKFNNGTQEFQLSGLKLYLAIALPMTAVTFLAWYIFFRLAKRVGFTSNEGNTDYNQSNAV